MNVFYIQLQDQLTVANTRGFQIHNKNQQTRLNYWILNFDLNTTFTVKERMALLHGTCFEKAVVSFFKNPL